MYDRVPEDARKILLYVEFIDDGVISTSLFYDLESGVLHYADPGAAFLDIDRAIDKELFRMQDLFGPDVKAIEFEIQGDRFSNRFAYADEFDAVAGKPARTDAVLRRCFGHCSAQYQSLL